MVKVRVGQHHGIYGIRRYCQPSPSQFTQVLHTLEQAAVDEDAGVAVGQQVFGAGNGTGAAKTGQSQHRHSPPRLA